MGFLPPSWEEKYSISTLNFVYVIAASSVGALFFLVKLCWKWKKFVRGVQWISNMKCISEILGFYLLHEKKNILFPYYICLCNCSFNCRNFIFSSKTLLEVEKICVVVYNEYVIWSVFLRYAFLSSILVSISRMAFNVHFRYRYETKLKNMFLQHTICTSMLVEN